MEEFNRKKHWETIYTTKALNEVSWYQPTPHTSLEIIDKSKLPKDARIIDIGGGDSFLVDHLLQQGYSNLSVLDISEAALERAKIRLGNKADQVTWIVADAANFKPEQRYHLWHDRAAFHFLTDKKEISNYLETAYKSIAEDGILILGTFSENGPLKCSGIPIQQYSEESLTELLVGRFKKNHCEYVNHPTPFNTVQNFVFCSFKKLTRSL